MREPIAAQRAIAKPREPLFAFLRDLSNHWTLTTRWVSVESMSPQGGIVRVHGPFGLARSASVAIEHADPPRLLRGAARLPGGTLAVLEWVLTPERDGEATLVTLSATMLDARLGDRLLLAGGGARWLAARLEQTLAQLDAQLASPVEHGHLRSA